MAAGELSRRGIRGLLFFGGLEIGYNVLGGTCSSPQTTELRVAGDEGGGAAESTLMKWVHLSVVKTFIYTGIVSIISGSWMPLLGGALAMTDMHGSYRYAVHAGRRRNSGKTPPARETARSGMSAPDYIRP